MNHDQIPNSAPSEDKTDAEKVLSKHEQKEKVIALCSEAEKLLQEMNNLLDELEKVRISHEQQNLSYMASLGRQALTKVMQIRQDINRHSIKPANF